MFQVHPHTLPCDLIDVSASVSAVARGAGSTLQLPPHGIRPHEHSAEARGERSAQVTLAAAGEPSQDDQRLWQLVLRIPLRQGEVALRAAVRLHRLIRVDLRLARCDALDLAAHCTAIASVERQQAGERLIISGTFYVAAAEFVGEILSRSEVQVHRQKRDVRGNITAAHAFTELNAVGQTDVPVRSDMYRVRTKVAMRVADAAFCGALSDERTVVSKEAAAKRCDTSQRFLADRVVDER